MTVPTFYLDGGLTTNYRALPNQYMYNLYAYTNDMPSMKKQSGAYFYRKFGE